MNSKEVAALFSTPAGKKFLNYLEDTTIRKPTLGFPEGRDGVGSALAMAYRDGENGLARWIIEQVKKGERENSNVGN